MVAKFILNIPKFSKKNYIYKDKNDENLLDSFENLNLDEFTDDESDEDSKKTYKKKKPRNKK